MFDNFYEGVRGLDWNREFEVSSGKKSRFAISRQDPLRYGFNFWPAICLSAPRSAGGRGVLPVEQINKRKYSASTPNIKPWLSHFDVGNLKTFSRTLHVRSVR